MKKPRIREGDIVRIVFWDHAEGEDEVLMFEVFGRVAKVSRRHYTVDSWGYADRTGIDRENERENIKTFNILKAVVESIDVLGPKVD